uniref:Wu:fe02h09 n=1 Tax=Cyprinus carpio TaxID=7962 RepID=A0A8C1L4X1_CYPCA
QGDHSRNLACFVLTYKGLQALQQHLQGNLCIVKGFRNGAVYGAKIRAPNALVMTFLFRSGSLREKIAQALQHQVSINMYLLSRILFALSRLAVEKGFVPQPRKDTFPLFGALYHPHTLQPSLQSSMNYLYHDSNTWHDISDFLIYNKPKTNR